jgi:hypothetical protein
MTAIVTWIVASHVTERRVRSTILTEDNIRRRRQLERARERLSLIEEKLIATRLRAETFWNDPEELHDLLDTLMGVMRERTQAQEDVRIAEIAVETFAEILLEKN